MLKGVCSYILYWAVEDGKVTESRSLIESDEMQTSDQDRVKRILEAVVTDGRIVSVSDGTFQKRWVKQKRLRSLRAAGGRIITMQ